MNDWRLAKRPLLGAVLTALILGLVTTSFGAAAVPPIPVTHSAGHPAARTATGPVQVPLRHVQMFGGNDALATPRLSAKLGALVSPVREYYKLGPQGISPSTFPSTTSVGQMRAHRTLVVSLGLSCRSRKRAVCRRKGNSYASVASGAYDKKITAFLQSMVYAAHHYHLVSIYFCFQHEPDNPKHRGFGTPAEFKAAWNHVHQIAVNHNLDADQPHGKLRWVWILIQGAFRHHTAAAFWPGRTETDIIGVDGFNTGKPFGGAQTAQPAIFVRTPSEIFDPAMAFAQKQAHKPMFVTEYGSIAYTDARIRPGWIHSMQNYVLNHPAIKAVLYWDSKKFKVNKDPDSIKALAAMAKAFG